ncbi:MAG: motility associated factor glycosyltransferase family protein, partial [Spirochaetales bacterium]|nr:motility associated factor glycosyltransferase family protein [Spirochaetales bacterium]
EAGLLDISLKSGGSVATAAWDLAMEMGCDRIYCAGLDLGFPGKQTHCRGSFFEERVNYLSHRFAGPEEWSWQALHSAPLSIRENYFGEKILSDQRMQVYISWFSEHVRQSSDRTVNLSRRGTLIEGMPFHSREEMLSLPPVRGRIEEIKGDLTREIEYHGEDVRVRIGQLIASLDQAIAPVAEAERTARELEDAFLDGKPLEELLNRLDRLDSEIAHEAAREIGGFLIQPHLQAIEENQTAGGLGIIRNSLMLYGELLRSLRYHRDIFASYS